MRWFSGLLLTVLLTVGFGAVALADYAAGLKAAQAGDFATAFREWKTSAEQGDAGAQYNLGQMYRRGDGVAQDYNEAVRWYHSPCFDYHQFVVA
jgi:uncharacterized protein